jgi:signal recognition particle GTPase
LIGFNPKSLPKAGPLFKGETAECYSKPSKPEMIIMVGSVGSGKSTFVANHLKDYVRINRD